LYYSNAKAAAERMLAEALEPRNICLTIFRPCYISGPRRAEVAMSYRKGAMFNGHDPRIQFVHEDDVVAAFVRATCSDLPGAYNVVPDDSLRRSQVLRIAGVDSPPTVPVWLARLILTVQWRFFGASIHPSWLDTLLLDATASNTKLRATGWSPRYNTEAAFRSAL
jgi:UDP-glucose 4-epimerase